jgi:hypothetical protein
LPTAAHHGALATALQRQLLTLGDFGKSARIALAGH